MFTGAEDQIIDFLNSPKLINCTSRTKYSILLKKLIICSYYFDLKSSKHVEERELKGIALLEMEENVEK